MARAPFSDLGADASDLMRIVMWADNDPQKLARLYRRYPKASRITVPMVERFLGEERQAWCAAPHGRVSTAPHPPRPGNYSPTSSAFRI
jgi:hypothetical protein